MLNSVLTWGGFVCDLERTPHRWICKKESKYHLCEQDQGKGMHRISFNDIVQVSHKIFTQIDIVNAVYIDLLHITQSPAFTTDFEQTLKDRIVVLSDKFQRLQSLPDILTSKVEKGRIKRQELKNQGLWGKIMWIFASLAAYFADNEKLISEIKAKITKFPDQEALNFLVIAQLWERLGFNLSLFEEELGIASEDSDLVKKTEVAPTKENFDVFRKAFLIKYREDSRINQPLSEEAIKHRVRMINLITVLQNFFSELK